MSELAPGAGPGRIEQRTFLGEQTDYQVRLGAVALQVAASDRYWRPPIEAGQSVEVRFTLRTSTCSTRASAPCEDVTKS